MAPGRLPRAAGRPPSGCLRATRVVGTTFWDATSGHTLVNNKGLVSHHVRGLGSPRQSEYRDRCDRPTHLGRALTPSLVVSAAGYLRSRLVLDGRRRGPAGGYPPSWTWPDERRRLTGLGASFGVKFCVSTLSFCRFRVTCHSSRGTRCLRRRQ